MELRDLIDSILILIILNNFTQILNVLAQIPKCDSCSLALLNVFQFSVPGFYFAGNFLHFGKYLHIFTRASYNFSSSPNGNNFSFAHWDRLLVIIYRFLMGGYLKTASELGVRYILELIHMFVIICLRFVLSHLNDCQLLVLLLYLLQIISFCSNSIFFDINGNIENTSNLPNLLMLTKQKSLLNPRN